MKQTDTAAEPLSIVAPMRLSLNPTTLGSSALVRSAMSQLHPDLTSTTPRHPKSFELPKREEQRLRREVRRQRYLEFTTAASLEGSVKMT